jgi:hypothetical protein
MTIFRFSCVAFLLLSSCAEQRSNAPQPEPTFDYQFRVFRDGSPVNPLSLLEDKAENPNMVELKNSGREWVIEGEVLTIRKFDPTLDKIVGFGIPLKVSDNLRVPGWLAEDGLERRAPIQDVSVFMTRYNLKKAAGLKVGQKVKVSCKGMRSFDSTLIFDDCSEDKSTK